jgi:predicted metal-dependent peptidase
LKADGTMDEIYPARIARYANYFVSQLGKDPETAILKKYYPKNIIWTFEVPTAATDGVRVFFNPAFADHLFSLDFILKERRLKSNPNLDPDDIDGTMFKFTLIHEIYHQIYRHMYRIRMKPETANAMQEPRIMDLANIACDVEINRDIEFQLPQFEGCTEVLQGMYDKRFTHETWELIFDAYNDPNSGK